MTFASIRQNDITLGTVERLALLKARALEIFPNGIVNELVKHCTDNETSVLTSIFVERLSHYVSEYDKNTNVFDVMSAFPGMESIAASIPKIKYTFSVNEEIVTMLGKGNLHATLDILAAAEKVIGKDK